MNQIRNDQELAVMRERVAKIEHLLETLRKTTRPEEWPALSSGYRLEIERMQGEILDYLVQGAPRRANLSKPWGGSACSPSGALEMSRRVWDEL